MIYKTLVVFSLDFEKWAVWFAWREGVFKTIDIVGFGALHIS
jgi:hypothetical protein